MLDKLFKFVGLFLMLLVVVFLVTMFRGCADMDSNMQGPTSAKYK